MQIFANRSGAYAWSQEGIEWKQLFVATRLNASSWEVLSGPTFSEFYNMISTNSQLAN